MEQELAEKNLSAVIKNHIGVIENKQWERLPSSLWSLKDAFDKWNESRQAAVSENDCKHEGGKMRGELYNFQICTKCGEEY